jgi:PAS domain S-box-containing protein
MGHSLRTNKLIVKKFSASWLLIALAALFVLVWACAKSGMLQGGEMMPLFIHILMETSAIVIAMLIFAVTWHVYEFYRAANTVILSCGFLAIGLLHFGHMLSFRGMPDFITPSDIEKGIQFWLCGQVITALVMLAVALNPVNKLIDRRTRYVMLIVTLMATAAMYWLVIFHQHEWPRTFIAESGLTQFKIGAEYVVIAILGIAAICFRRQLKRKEGNAFDSINLFAACLVAILGELCFVSYRSAFDIFNLLGHVYSIIAYLFVYFVVIINNVRRPISRLRKTSDELASSKIMLQSVINNVPVRIFWKDKTGRFLGANKLFLQDAGLEEEDQILGKDDFALFPMWQAEAFQADDRVVMETAQPKLNIEEPIQTADGRMSWLLTNKVPLRGKDGEVVGILGAYTDISKLRKTELQLEEVVFQLRELIVKRENAREAERKRVAQDLHDDLGQTLTSLRLEAYLLSKQHGFNNPALVSQVSHFIQHIDETIQIVRNVASQLRPAVLDDGISSALEWQISRFNMRSGIPCALTVDVDDAKLDSGQATTLFRIVQESLTNIMRHSSARQASVKLIHQSESCLLEVQDDGVGFDPTQLKKSALGLIGIRERAMVLRGTVEITSAPMQGTKISILFPLELTPEQP